jgi:hypothetical protein
MRRVRVKGPGCAGRISQACVLCHLPAVWVRAAGAASAPAMYGRWPTRDSRPYKGERRRGRVRAIPSRDAEADRLVALA